MSARLMMDPTVLPWEHMMISLCAKLYERFSEELKGVTFNFWGRCREVKFPGKAGDFCMSFQRGTHRGWPQKCGHHRYALVQTFMPEGMEP